MTTAQSGDLVVLVSSDKKRFVVRLVPGEQFHCHRGFIRHDDLIGRELGQEVRSHTHYRFLVLRPSFDELLMTVRRATQIVYPKDIGYILLKLSVASGTRVVEAGAGSGALTCAFARYVSPGGHVYSYEARADMLQLAQTNIARLGLEEAVTFQQRDVQADGFDETDVDAVFLDMREPWLAMEPAAAALANGGFLGTLVPTVNQVVDVAYALERGPFRDVEIAEIMLRLYKTTAERVRPLDRMTAHTGYLIFARKITRTWAGTQAGEPEDEAEPAAEHAAEPLLETVAQLEEPDTQAEG
jgi:tRNA (adenine57-N1/adenine58-N1)-methyltransferase catalytic subunit